MNNGTHKNDFIQCQEVRGKWNTSAFVLWFSQNLKTTFLQPQIRPDSSYNIFLPKANS